MRPSEYIQKGWCKRVPATDSNGNICDPREARAVKWCLYGAILACYQDDRAKIEALCSLLTARLTNKFGIYTNNNIGIWNDTHTKEEVIALLQGMGE